MKLGTNDITSFKVGTTNVDSIYLGTELVWGGSQPTTSGGVVTLTFSDSSTSSVTYSDGIVPNSAFTNNLGIVAVEIGSGITRVNTNAFAQCSNISSVTIANTVTRLGGYCFSGCTALTSVYIPDSVTEFGGGVFSYCSGLTSVTIGSGFTTFSNPNAFQGCRSLTSITINATTAPTLVNGTFSQVPAVGTLSVPYGSDYSSWIGTGATSSNQLASGWTISYIMPPLGAYEIRAKMSDNSIVTVTSTTATIGDAMGYFPETSYLGDYFPDESNIVEIEFGSSIYGFGEFAFSSCRSLEYIRIHNLSPDFRSGGEPDVSYPQWGENTSGKLVFSMDLPLDYEVTYFDGALPENWVVCYEFERDVVITNSSQSNGEVALTYRDGIDGELETIIYLGEGESTTISAGTLWQGAASGEEYNISNGSGQKITIEPSPNFNYGGNYTFDSINVSGVTQESLDASGFYPFNDYYQEIYMYGVSAMTFEVTYTYEEPCEPEEGCIDWDFENCVCRQFEEPEPEPEPNEEEPIE